MAPYITVWNDPLTLTWPPSIDITSYYWHDLFMTHNLWLLTLPLQISNNATDLSHVTAQLDHCKCCSALHTPSNTARAGYVRNNGTHLTLEHWNIVYIWTLESNWKTGTKHTFKHWNTVFIETKELHWSTGTQLAWGHLNTGHIVTLDNRHEN